MFEGLQPDIGGHLLHSSWWVFTWHNFKDITEDSLMNGGGRKFIKNILKENNKRKILYDSHAKVNSWLSFIGNNIFIP